MEIGGYRAEELLGQGATASVYRAVSPTGKVVALKVFDGPYERALDAAKRQAGLTAQVDHPHLARIVALLCDADQVALAVELGEAGSLADLLARRRRLTPPEVLTVIIPIASALATAHERGVVHGDLSPANIIFDAAGRPMLTDLGAARVAIDCGLPVAATPGYVAPEVARGAVPDAAADVFSLGAVALHCLSGRPAWNADDLRDVVVQSTVGQWPDPDDADGPRAVLAAIRSALGDTPERRPGAASLVMELSHSGTPEPIDLSAPAGATEQTGKAPHGASGKPVSEHPELIQRAPRQHRHRAAEAVEAVSQQRIRPVATRVRADTARPESAPSVVRGHDRRWWFRTAAAVLALAVIGTLAIQAGLIWAGSGAKTGAAPLTRAASSSTSAPATTPTGRPASTPSTASPAHPTVPATFPTVTATPPTGQTPTATTHRSSTAAHPTPGSHRSTSPTGEQTTGWTSVVQHLDAVRADALVRRDTSRLSQVYATGAVPLADDAKTINTLVSNGFRVAGAAHRIVATKLLTSAAPSQKGGETVRLAVTDSLPSYRVLDANGAVVGSTVARASATRVLDLVKTTGGYRIVAVTTV